MSNPEMSPVPSRRRPLRRGLAAAGLFAAGLVVGATGLAVAHGDGMTGWHHHHHGPRVGMVQNFARRALDNVGATSAQEDKVHDIIATAYTALQKGGADHDALRKETLDLIKAPTLDKAAFEKLRTQKLAELEAKSKVVSDALFEAASQLSPEQRAKLVGNIEARAEHGGWGGWHHRDRTDGPDGAPHGDHDGEHGPNPDHG